VSPTGCANAAAVANVYLTFAGGRLADVWMMPGDNAYPIGSENQYTAGVFDTYPEILRNHVLWPSPDNHEFGASDSPTQTGPYYEAFRMPTGGEAGGWPSGSEAYYAFDHGNVHFVVLDSHDTSRAAPANPTANVRPAGQGGAMYQWLCTDLANTDRDRVIAYWHHPPYTKGSHDSDDPADSLGALFEMREHFVPVLEHFGVDLQLTGHSHSYERSVLIDGHYGTSSEFGPQHVKDGGDGDPQGDGAYWKPTLGPAPHEGTVYSVVGSSSFTSGGPLNHPIMTVSINQLGSMVIDVEGPVLDGYWIDTTGTVRDHFRIAKGSERIPALSPFAFAAAAAALVRRRRSPAPARPGLRTHRPRAALHRARERLVQGARAARHRGALPGHTLAPPRGDGQGAAPRWLPAALPRLEPRGRHAQLPRRALPAQVGGMQGLPASGVGGRRRDRIRRSRYTDPLDRTLRGAQRRLQRWGV
jgi:hypothetical protein